MSAPVFRAAATDPTAHLQFSRDPVDFSASVQANAAEHANAANALYTVSN